MISNNKKGFTLTELLLVVTIIAFLSAAAAITYTTSRMKTRDGRRVSDIKQMYTTMEIVANTTPGVALEGCDGAYDLTSSCTGPALIINDMVKFYDPLGSVPCQPGVVAETCNYSISRSDGTAEATVDYFQICFLLEGNTISYNAGLHSINDQGVIAGCN